MADLVRFPLEDGASIVVEVEAGDRGAVRRGRGVDERIQEAGETLEGVLARAAPVAASVVAKLREQGERPSEVEVEFGVKLSAEAGVVIARTAGDANFRLVVKWAKADVG
jgi:hypothetical protein